MIGKEHISGNPVTVAESLETLEERKKAGELGYEQQIAYDHAKKFASMSADKARKFTEDLSETGISKKAMIKVIDVMPQNEVQLRNVLLIEKKTIEADVIKSVLDVIAKYKGK
ncbi:MAG: RNA polymerase Rpb4 family protein [Candidatus Micrarchaeales archaeon]